MESETARAAAGLIEVLVRRGHVLVEQLALSIVAVERGEPMSVEGVDDVRLAIAQWRDLELMLNVRDANDEL